jgi:hypothetical protein
VDTYTQDAATAMAMGGPPPDRGHPRIRITSSLLILLVGVGVLWVGLREFQLTKWRNDADLTVAATVDGKKIDSSSKGVSHHVVQYHFRYKGKTYSSTDATYRTHLWTRLRVDAWNELDEHGTVPVAFNRHHPQANRPVESGSHETADNWGALVFAGILLWFGFVIAFKPGMLTSKKKPEAGATDEEPSSPVG